MLWRIRVRPGALAALLLATTAPAAAQEVGGVLDMTGMGIYAMEDAVMEAAQESVTSPRKASPATAKLTRYTPSAERRRANLARFVDKVRARDPNGATRLKSLFATTDVIGAMGKEIARYGLRIDDAADAYAVWWMNAWLASRGRNDTPSQGQITAVKAQAARALASAPGFATASDAAKQELAEAHLVQAALIESYVSGARGDSKLLRKIAEAVRQGARRSGLDLDTMELTPTGFVPR